MLFYRTVDKTLKLIVWLIDFISQCSQEGDARGARQHTGPHWESISICYPGCREEDKLHGWNDRNNGQGFHKLLGEQSKFSGLEAMDFVVYGNTLEVRK